MENILWDDVVFKLRKTRQKLALSLTPLGAVRAAAEGTGYKNRRLGKPRAVYASTRDVLVWSVRCDTEPETAAQSYSCSQFWVSLGTLTLCLFCMHRSGCSYCDASGEFCLPSLRVLSGSFSAYGHVLFFLCFSSFFFHQTYAGARKKNKMPKEKKTLGSVSQTTWPTNDIPNLLCWAQSFFCLFFTKQW